MDQLKWAIAAIVTAILSVVSLQVAAQPKVKLRLGHVTSAVSIAGQGAKALAEAAKRLSNGEIEVEIFPNSQLGGELEMLSQVRLGTLDIAMSGSGVVAAIEPTFSITELPFIWKDGDTAWKVLTGPVGDRILGTLDAKGIKGLSWGVWGFRGFLMNQTDITTPASMKGKKIRVVENPLYVRTIQAFGASPVPMAWPEVYTALQQGTIDGVETNYAGMADAKLHEVAKHLAVSDHIWTATVYLMNLNRFKALSVPHQKVIVQAAREAGEVMREGAERLNRDAIALMEKSGVKVSKPDRAAMIEAVSGVHKYFSTLVGSDLLKAVEDAQK